MIIPADVYMIRETGEPDYDRMPGRMYINSKKIIFLYAGNNKVELENGSSIYITNDYYDKFKELLFKAEGIVDDKND